LRRFQGREERRTSMTSYAASAFSIDLVSDTATKPCAAMRNAIANAVVGDEQRDEDPTVNLLNERVAKLLGQEAAIFLPSGTMCNQIALAVHCSSGDEIIAAANSHIISSEGSGAAVFAGSTIHQVQTASGIFGADELKRWAEMVNISGAKID